MSLFAQTYTCLMQADPAGKVAQTEQLFELYTAGKLTRESSDVVPIAQPGHPPRPQLVALKHLPKRSVHTEMGRAALIHSFCHIEFNAINLALDAVYRFRDMPDQYYHDWLKVAKEEAYHYTLLAEHLQELGYAYGDFAAHNGLWETAVQTAHDPLVRMALVPRVLEARGLDVTPAIIEQFTKLGAGRIVAIMQIIHRDEIGHVEIGTCWYRYLCEQRQLDPFVTFKNLLAEYLKGELRGPFAYATRKQAGFTDEELAFLEKAI